MKADGSLTAWGNPSYGGSGVPFGKFDKVVSTLSTFAALKQV